jgi:hypothetical protein
MKLQRHDRNPILELDPMRSWEAVSFCHYGRDRDSRRTDR